jgi:hypothetical protein
MISEALLEMHFHASLIDLFESFFGAKFVKLLKPTQPQECWVGFDQGWASTSLSERALYEELKTAIRDNKTDSIEKMYLGYFFQFKIVDNVTRRSKLMPSSFSTPYYRSELSLQPNSQTGISQHETLQRLLKVKNALVYYACGMLFDSGELYQKPVDLERLRFVPVAEAPSGWATNQRHFIVFQTIDDSNPKWCSTPVDGSSISINQLLDSDRGLGLLTPAELLKLIEDSANAIRQEFQEKSKAIYLPNIQILPSSFTVIEFERNKTTK